MAKKPRVIWISDRPHNRWADEPRLKSDVKYVRGDFYELKDEHEATLGVEAIKLLQGKLFELERLKAELEAAREEIAWTIHDKLKMAEIGDDELDALKKELEAAKKEIEALKENQEWLEDYHRTGEALKEIK
jgi:predicted RNase H-like nuclease (RuvC/YqgF family)